MGHSDEESLPASVGARRRALLALRDDAEADESAGYVRLSNRQIFSLILQRWLANVLVSVMTMAAIVGDAITHVVSDDRFQREQSSESLAAMLEDLRVSGTWWSDALAAGRGEDSIVTGKVCMTGELMWVLLLRQLAVLIGWPFVMAFVLYSSVTGEYKTEVAVLLDSLKENGWWAEHLDIYRRSFYVYGR